MAKKNPHIVLIGGGTGSFTILSELKRHTSNITALVNMVDDGGSTGVLRDEYGVLPPGDIRQCLVALSESPQQLRELFNFRFPADTTFAGHSFGNLFLSAVELMTNDFSEAVQLASETLRITGKVVPVTLDNRHLILTLPDGKTVVGQYAAEVENELSLKGCNLCFDTDAMLNPAAKAAIEAADLIVIAPGNLYVSLIPTLIVNGMTEALADTKVSVAYICNLINKPRHTVGYAVHDYASELERFIGAPILTHVIYNTDTPTEEQLATYALEGEFPIRVDSNVLKSAHYSAIPAHMLSHAARERDKNDTFIKRSLIRHDAEAVCRELLKLI